MHCFIIFAHPSRTTVTGKVLDEFVRGLASAGHCFEISDLYRMKFDPVMDFSQYQREVRATAETVPDDVKKEHEKIQKADALVFIYPNWWSDCPAILKGWFDKVWSYGFAYEYIDNKRCCRIKPRNALVICTAGYTGEALESNGIGPSMKTVMVSDRLRNQHFENIRMEFLGGMPVGKTEYRDENLRKAHEMGRDLEKYLLNL